MTNVLIFMIDTLGLLVTDEFIESNQQAYWQWRIQEMFVGEAEKSEEVDKHTKRRKLGVRGFFP